MSKISENKIPNISADWGKDPENGLPYSGQAVQDFIKEQLNSKYGYFYYDENNNRYLVFTSEESKDKYFDNPEENKDLLFTSFDAPFNYSARIEMITKSYNAVLIGTTGNNLEFKFATEDKSGNSVGENVDCTIVFTNQGVKQTVGKIFTAEQGREGVLIELDNYLKEGTNNISITIKGSNTLAATTVSIVYQIVNLKLHDDFNISTVYKPGDILEVSCVVEGAGTKIIDWYLDGVKLPYEIIDEIPYITAYTVNKNISLEGITPGVHSLQYRLRSQVGENWFESQTFFRNFFVEGLDKTIVGIAAELPIGVDPVNSNILDKLYGMIQYVPYTIRYAIYNPSESATNTLQILLNDEVHVITNIVNNREGSSSVMCSSFGNVPVKIIVNGVSYDLISNTAVSTLGVKEIGDAKLNLRAFGKDNDSLDRDSWTYGNYSTTFEGLYWNAQSGWVDNTLIINANASASIDYVPFENDPMITGKTIEVEFATRNVVDHDDVILDLTNDSGHGLSITASEAKLVTSDNKELSTKFKAEELNRISFVINRRESGNNAGFAFIYVNGILSGAAEYTDTATIRVIKNIVFSGKSDVLLKQIVIYDKPLSSDEILNNYILYRDSISEMLSIYNRNNVTTADGQLSPEKLVNTLPVLYMTGLDETRGIPFLETQTGKEATKINTYFDIDYENAQDKTRNFSLKYARVRIQGTSSSYYPRKNYRFYSAKEDETIMYDYKGNVIPDGLYSFTGNAQPVDCWCLKTDYAESSGSHNTGVSKLWNNVMKGAVIDKENKLMTTAQKIAAESKYPYDVRTTVDGFPIVVFYRNSYNHPWQFLGKFNFNNDKSTPSVFGFCDIPGFDNSRMQCWEILNNGHALCNFVEYSSEYFDKNWKDAFEARYDEDNPLIDDLKALCEWIYSTKGASNGIEILDETLMNKFKIEKWDHFDVYKMAAYYVYIMRFGAVDQTVKNSMITADDGEHFYFINYDNDTIFGVRNDGLLKHSPYIDRQSIDPEKANTDNPYVYAGHDSVLWNNLECDDEFMEIVKVVDSALYDAGLTYSAVINMFENEQTLKWCERVCNTDAHYKYISPPSGRVIESLQGNRNSHRRWWVSERFNLYDAKFVTGEFKTNVIELKIVGEQIPFAKITAAKRQPYGYSITNSASLITDVLNIGDTYEFTSPVGQTLQEGDPISIYSASNISELDLSGCVSCAMKIDLSRIQSETVGNSLKKLIMNGVNESLTDTTFTGTDKLNRLEYLDIQGLHKLGTIDLSNSLNLKTLLAKDTGLTSVKLAPGCLIERLELPISTAAVVLQDLPLLTADNLILEGDWANVRQINISGCPNLTNNFNIIWNWFNKTSNIDVRSLKMSGIDWVDVNIDELIELGAKVNVAGGLKGKIKLKRVDDKLKLQTLKSLFGNNIFDKDSDLYIYGPNGIFIFGPENILEGDSYQFETVIFSDDTGVLLFGISEGDRVGVEIDNNGLLTSVENGSNDSILKVEAIYLPDKGGRIVDGCYVTVKKRIYPTNVSITGPTRISEENTVFTWSSPTVGITGQYVAEWSLEGDILNYVRIQNQTPNQCTILRIGTPENLATGILRIKLIKNLDGALISETVLHVNVVNPDVIMTSVTNPEVMSLLYRSGKLSSSEYLLKQEAELFTTDDLSIILGTNVISHFDEFKYFTGVTEIPVNCFNNMSKLTSIVLPESIKTIGRSAFSNVGLTYIYIPESVINIDVDAFGFSNYLTTIEVDRLNRIYHSHEGCIYKDSHLSTLYLIAPGLTEYIMPDETTSVYGVGDVVWKNGRKLQRVVLNNKVSGIGGLWFLYGFENLIEVTGPEDHPNVSFYNGCIYDKTFTELIYWPSAKSYSEDGLYQTENLKLGNYSFVQHKKLSEFIIPNNVTEIGTWVFYNTSATKFVVHENVKTIGDQSFSWNSKLKTLEINTPGLTGTHIAAYCTSLTSVILNDNTTSIPANTFTGCTALPEIDIPSGVTSLGYEAFLSCSMLQEITIPENVINIGNGCFSGCLKLGTINCLSVIAPTLGYRSFGDNSANYTGYESSVKNVYYPANGVGYDTGDWQTVLEEIVGFEFKGEL